MEIIDFQNYVHILSECFISSYNIEPSAASELARSLLCF